MRDSLLLLWTILGAGLRLANLDLKPPWTDEFGTLVLALGNSFESLPLDRVISFQDLLALLIPNPSATVGDVIHQVFGQYRQPPLYFALVHLFLPLFPTDGGLVNLWGARALPALLGILTIPGIYFCSYLIWRSRLIANFTAAMLAVSPYGVYISQEARHYSLASLWVAISMSCLAIACRQLSEQQKLSVTLIGVWIVVNNLGLATHYLFSLALIAEALSVGLCYLYQLRKLDAKRESDRSLWSIASQILRHPSWQRLYLVIVGTATGGAIGWWLLAHTNSTYLTAWLDNTPHKSIEIVNPLFQILGAAITMMSLLLVEVTDLPPVKIFSEMPIDLNLPTIIVSAVLMLIFFGWALPILKRGIWLQLQPAQLQAGTIAIGSFVAISIGLYLVIPWLTGIDITRGARYQFVYFPGVMMLIGLGLASCWEHVPSIATWVSGKQAVITILLMGLISSAIVSSNYGYHKYYRPEQIVPMMQQSAPMPVLIATTHNHLVQVGEMMGLAWEMRRTNQTAKSPKIQFLLAHQFQKFCDRDCPTTDILRNSVDRISHSIDLWLVNFHAPISLPPTCEEDKKFTRGVYGYEYRLYHCQPIKDID